MIEIFIRKNKEIYIFYIFSVYFALRIFSLENPSNKYSCKLTEERQENVAICLIKLFEMPSLTRVQICAQHIVSSKLKAQTNFLCPAEFFFIPACLNLVYVGKSIITNNYVHLILSYLAESVFKEGVQYDLSQQHI